jgi:ketosteroid isomerase-like protein
MSAQQNTRLVQDFYEKFSAHEIAPLLSALAPDIEWQLPAMENVPFAGTWRGHDGVLQFMRTLDETQEVIDFRPEEFVAQDDEVIVLGHFKMRVKATGRVSESAFAHVWNLDAGKFTRFREYVDTAAVSHAHRR